MEQATSEPIEPMTGILLPYNKYLLLFTDINVSSQTAVVQGAVLRGIGLGADVAPRIEFCPRHYGVCINERYDQSTQSQRGSQTSRRSSRIMWMVRQGDSIVPGIACKTSLTLHAYLTKSQYRAGSSVPISLVATNASEPSLSLSGLREGMFSAFHCSCAAVITM